MKRLGVRLRTLVRRSWVKKALAVLVLCLVLLNGGVYLAYRQRTYPRTAIAGHAIGSIPYPKLPRTLEALPLLPKQLTVSADQQKAVIDPAAAGLRPDVIALTRRVQTRRHWLPMANLLMTHKVDGVLRVDQAAFDRQLAAWQQQFQRPPANARLTVENGVFTLYNDTAGYELSASNVQATLLAAIGGGKRTVVLPTTTRQPAVRAATLQAELQSLQRQQKTGLTYTYQGKSAKPTAAEVASWYDAAGTSLAPADAKIQVYIAKLGGTFGIRVKDAGTVARTTKDALQKNKALTYTLEASPLPHKTLTYCVSARGVDAGELTALKNKLAATYADSRGWSLGGQVSFTEVASGCNFAVWLSAAEQMPTFGAICDAEWSCAVTPNVVINFNRWRFASPAWNAIGGSLEDYRAMVINHETGHWFGMGHADCPGAGQPAPVMQQQSINLQGCTFNPWPAAGELAHLRRVLQL